MIGDVVLDYIQLLLIVNRLLKRIDTVMNQLSSKSTTLLPSSNVICDMCVNFAEKVVNLQFLFLTIIISSTLISGCGPTYVGPKLGYNIPLQSADNIDGLSTGEHTGAIEIGAVFEQYMSSKFSLLIEPSVSSKFTDQFDITQISGRTTFNIFTKYSYSTFQIPLIAKFSAPIEGSSVKPYFSFGTRLLLISRGSLSSSGNYIDTSNTKKPFSDYYRSTSSGYSIDAMLSAGIDYTLSDTWILRFDTRYQRSLGDVYRIYSYAITPNWSDDASFTLNQSFEHLTLSLSLLMKL